MFAPKKILVPTDFTNDSDRALREAVDIAKAFNSKVFLIHVDQKIQEAAADYLLSPSEIKGLEKADADVATGKMRAEILKIAQNAAVEIEIAEKHGKTHEEILAFGREKEIDLIVIEPHARKGLLKTLVNGVADKVAHEAACSVLVLH